MSGAWSSFVPWNLINEQRGRDTERDRISNEEFGWNQQMADMNNTNEIGRQSTFLKGMVPAQAESYNAYQDSTQPQDTQRQIDRIQTTAKGLGMSPWELNGGSGATPLPAQQFMSGQAKNTQSADPYGMMQAALQSRTALKIAAMNNDTSIRNTAMQTGNARYLDSMSPKAQAGIQNTETETQLKLAQKRLAETTDAKTRSEILRGIVSDIKDLLPTYTNNLEFFKENGISGGNTLAAFLMQNSKDLFNAEAQEALDIMARNVPKTKIDTDITELLGIVKAGAGVAKNAINSASSIGMSVKGFLKNMATKP